MGIRVQRQSLFLILVTGFLSLNRVESIRFDLDSGHTRCISEDIKAKAMTVGKYHIVNPNEGQPLPDSYKVTVRVTSSYGNNYHSADNVSEGTFSFHAPEEGDYMACFFASDHKHATTMTVDFEWKSGILAKDWTNVAKKGSVELMEIELKKMFDTVQSIHDEMFYLREREQEMHSLNLATNWKMAWLSFLSFLVCFSVAGVQLWHLKSFFEKKKLI